MKGLKERVARVVGREVGMSEEEVLELLELPPSLEFGDVAFPCFALAKKLKRAPGEIANELAGKLASKLGGADFDRGIADVRADGPYVNFFFDKRLVAEEILPEILEKRERFGAIKGKGERVVIESPSPNTNKPLHLGHLRNLVLAQSLKRILEFAGNEVLLVNLYNDRGSAICQAMVAYEKFAKGKTPESEGKKPDHFVGDLYVMFSKEVKSDESLAELAQECLRKWEANDKHTRELWEKLNSWALAGIEQTFERLGARFYKHYFESEVYNLGKEIVLEQLKKGKLKRKPDGAVFADLSKQGLGEKILLRADGTSIYITQDIGLAVLRKKELEFDKLIYVVAREQEYHFKALFSILKMFGYAWADRLFHLSYGMVNLPHGRMKSREGTVVDADDLLDELEELARREIESRHEGLSAREVEQRARAIALAALRYYLLKVESHRDIVFNPEESLEFDGNTGPYLLYTYARAKSILEKARQGPKGARVQLPEQLNPHEELLVLSLAKFPEVSARAFEQHAPNLIANYAYELAKRFNEFYHSTPVLRSECEEFRLALVESVAQVLKNALSLLEIETIEKM
ncbi:arginine--tRNA ligase [Candidatus Pacearchaeota archaeon]|nr:MAG: arginine--tRNA ligase [Candidatus Pacearchaeota archaeon]